WSRIQIVLSSPHMSEIWILDHSTTSDEAASHEGGASGHGGDLLYRHGNPKNYGGGSAADQVFFGQHNIQWIKKGLPGAGHLLVFNNGAGRGPGPGAPPAAAPGAAPGPGQGPGPGPGAGGYSSVVEFEPPKKG